MDEGLKALVFEGVTARTGAARRRGNIWVGVLVARASWGWGALVARTQGHDGASGTSFWQLRAIKHV